MSEQEILALAGMFKSISESVWEISLLYVHAQSLQYAIWAILFFVAAVGLLFGAVRAAHKSKADKTYEGVEVACVAGVIITLVFFGSFFAASVGRVVAPEWYALNQILLHLR